MAGAVLARVVLLLPLLAVTSRAGLPVILLVTLLVNAAAQFFMPAAAAAVPSVVGQEQVGRANGLLSLINGGIAAIGPGAARRSTSAKSTITLLRFIRPWSD